MTNDNTDLIQSDSESIRDKDISKAFDTDQIRDISEISGDGYFSKEIFDSLLSELKNCINLHGKSKLTHHGNFFRRGKRLLKIGESLKEHTIAVNVNTQHAAPTAEAYEYLEELSAYFQDTGHPDIHYAIQSIIANEVVSEIITILVVRPGRQKSAAVLALKYGLIGPEDEEVVLANAELDKNLLENYLYAAHLDIDEIASELQYKGDYKKRLSQITTSELAES